MRSLLRKPYHKLRGRAKAILNAAHNRKFQAIRTARQGYLKPDVYRAIAPAQCKEN